MNDKIDVLVDYSVAINRVASIMEMVAGKKLTEAQRMALGGALAVEFQILVADNARLLAELMAIHDFAQDHSTGPVVPDVLWEVRNMAHAAIAA